MIRMTLRKSTDLPLWSVELAVIHHLQQDVEQVGMGLLDLVEQQHGVGMLIDAVGQEAALVEADIAGRGADQPRYRMALHIFRHVEAQDMDAHDVGEPLGNLGLADAGRAGEQVAADRLLGLAQSRSRQLDRRGERIDRPVLAEHHALQLDREVAQHLGIVARHALGRDPRHGGDGLLDLLDADHAAAAGFRQQHLGCAGLVDDVDRLVGQLAVMHVARRQLHRRFRWRRP